MRYSNYFLLALIAVAIILISSTEKNDYPIASCKTDKDFSTCAAILFDGKMLVDKYAPDGTCRLEQNMKGKLTVAAVELTASVAIPTAPLSFRVAIQDGETGTLWLQSRSSVGEVLFEDIIKECKVGDKIVIITEQKSYSLPHNIIEIFKGC